MGSIYSVHQINKYIKNMIDQDFFLGNLQVQGEVSNCKYHSSGHIYFTLKDESAAISCVMFAGSRAGLTFSMRNGDKVVVSGSIGAYEKTGSYQLYAKKISKAGTGDLYEKFLALKKELEEMGMFASEYKKPIPRHVRTLGVVTAPTGAAIRDIQNISKRRNPGIRIILYPALVQGKGSKESIVKGIEALDKLNTDVIIVGRGGGSIEDLWAFNEECVARAVFYCRTPVISAVGHETDFTITDFVADLRAPTPSAAAELAVDDIFETIDKLNTFSDRLVFDARHYIEMFRLKNEQYQKKLDIYKPSNIVLRYREKLEKYNSILKSQINAISGYREKLEKYNSILKSQVNIISRYRDKLERYDSILKNQEKLILMDKKHILKMLCSRLEDLSPLKRLTAGFSYISIEEGKTLKSVNDIKKNDMLEIFLSDGIIDAKVEEIHTKENAI